MNEFLNKNNYLLLVKIHPLEEMSIKNIELSNIEVINTKEMNNNLISMNKLLSISDLLITDYSSVYFDYLITDKPILFTNADENEYSISRGFIFDDISFWRPGPKVNNIDSLKIEICNLFSNENYYSQEREKINNLVNIYKDGESSQRIYNKIFS